MEVVKERPNIRIQIQNQKMDVDGSENEDGEIIDEEPNVETQANARSVFTTGINIFDQVEQRKLQERAKRFSLKPEETYSFTDADLKELQESLGITEQNENITRFDTVHLIGINGMMVEDILDYFAKYAPSEIEFIDEHSCNVKWLENISAARAMFYTSRAVDGMPVRPQVTLGKDLLEDTPEDDEPSDQSILLKNRKVELQVDPIEQPKNEFKNAADISDITIPIPPGYWRLGAKHPKVKCLLLRFAFLTDKVAYKIERFSKYYKKLSNVKIGQEKQKEGGIFERNKELPRSKNPWGSLARNWDQDKFLETIPTSGETVEIKNPNIACRLGLKSAEEAESDVEIVEEETTLKKPKGKSMRMRMYADEEEERLKMKKVIQKIKKQTEKLTQEPQDLRTILALNNSYSTVENPDPVEIIDLVHHNDLGSRLRNRSRHVIYSADRDIEDKEYERNDYRSDTRSDIRLMLNRRREKSPYKERRILERSYRDRSPLRRYDSPVRDRSPHRNRSPIRRPERPNYERTVRYKKYPTASLRSDHRDNGFHSSKPKSQVSVVIKTPKKPSVASTIWSRVHSKRRHRDEESESESSSEDSSKSDDSESSSSSDSSDDSESDSESSSSSEEEDVRRPHRTVRRPGFEDYNAVIRPRGPMRITTANERYRRK